MKIRIKKIAALLLASLFLVGILPPMAALANPQGPVLNFEMINRTAENSRNYTLELMWTRPLAVLSGVMAGQPDWQAHRATQYELRRRNASVAGSPWDLIGQPINNSSEVISHMYVDNHLPANPLIPGAQMQEGRFYAFRIDAFHFHTININTPQQTTERVGNILGNQIYFMTDLNVEGSGVGDTLTVEFSRPLLNGADPFTGYRIFFSPGGTGVTNIHAQYNVDVLISDLTVSADGRRYIVEITDLPLIPGMMYAVAVEPFLQVGASRVMRHSNNPNLAEAFMAAHGRVLHYTSNEFRTNQAFVEPVFSGTPIGLNLLLLHWSFPREASQIILEFQRVGDPLVSRIGVLEGQAPSRINYWLVYRPQVPTIFRLRIFTQVGGIMVEQDPIEWLFDPTVTPFTPTRPDILEISNEPEPPVTGSPIFLDITWEAFHREPYTTSERASEANRRPVQGFADTRFFDPNVVFEIAISDNLDTLINMNMHDPKYGILLRTPAQLGFTEFDIDDANWVWAHTARFTHYFNTELDAVRPISPNTVYYVRIITRRMQDVLGVEQMRHEMSTPAFGSHFVGGDVETRPLIVPTPPLRVSNQTHNSIEIAWETRWFEGIDTTNAASIALGWQTVAFNGTTPVFGRNIGTTHTRLELEGIDNWRDANNFINNAFPIRMQSLPGNTGYELHVRPYSQITAEIAADHNDDFETFVTALQSAAGNWTTINPQADGITRRFNITSPHGGGTLAQNTTYGIFFRPFNPAFPAGNPLRNSWWPSFLAGTTTDVRDPMEITPTVPILAPYTAGDWWLRFHLRPFTPEPDMRYEFRISELPNIASSWVFDAIPERVFESGGHTWRQFAAVDLFPDTNYYIWARAIGRAADGSELISAWSNPIAMRTTPIRIPDPPRGLGLASANNVHIINMENDLEYQRIEPTAMIIEWMPKPGDNRLPIEIEDGAMGTEILGAPQISHAYMVRFVDLVPNRAYYVRARTILSITRAGVGSPGITRYDYIVQIATNPEFLDAITVHVMPDAIEIVEGLHTRMAMSVWTQTFIFHTLRDDGEYDGDVIAELFPLPDHDFEIIYNPATRTLTFRFRSTGVDAQGHQDNLVDQRFISRLIQTRVDDFTIDMSHYNHLPVANRVVELPHSIITAFAERQISFTVIAGDTNYTLSPGFAATPQNIGFNTASRLRFYINDTLLSNLPVLRYNQRYLTIARDVSVSVINPTNRVELTLLAAPLRVSHRINQGDLLDYNIASYGRGADDVGWNRLNSSFDEITGRVSTSSTRPQTFAAIGTGVPTQWGETSPAVRDALYFVNSRLAFTDMDWFMADSPINAWQINRIISAIARGETQVAINRDLTTAEVESLTNGGMLVPGAAEVTRQNALSALVRLFEVRTRSRIVGQPTLANSQFPDIATATPNLRDALLRAEFLGFLDHTTGLANPLGSLSMGDAMLIFEIILRN